MRDPNLETAQNIVTSDAEPDRELEKIPGIEKVGQFWTFSTAERQQLEVVSEQIKNYLLDPSFKRPFSLAVFGAPGSGKSFAVKSIAKYLRDSMSSPVGSLRDALEINLTQITSVAELTASLVAGLYAGATNSEGEGVPLIFFDEFDTSFAGASWGWLSWFLAPMQDGKFLHAGIFLPLQRSILVFAGGTAERYADFGCSNPARFTSAKGPDFKSRLRAYLDIQGINEVENRGLRRAALLQKFRKDRNLKLDKQLVKQLCAVSRYRFGARSLEALINMMHRPEHRPLSLGDLPDLRLRSMHVDRGPLDKDILSGGIGFSGSAEEIDQGGHGTELWQAIATSLLEDGASIIFGGRPRMDLTHKLRQAIIDLPAGLYRTDESGNCLERQSPWVKLFHDDSWRASKRHINDTGLGKSEEDPEEMETITGRWREQSAEVYRATKSGQQPLDARTEKRWIKAMALFSRRHEMSTQCVARFALGGRLDTKNGRFPGIAEEIMLALAMKQPVYISGRLGDGQSVGAARWVGQLLGLGNTWMGEPRGFDKDVYPDEIVQIYAHFFRPPPLFNLPTTRAELVLFLENHALGGPLWPDNGLTEEENRELFKLEELGEIISLVRKGLRRRFAQ